MTPSRPEDPSIPDPPVRDSTGASAPKVDPEDLMLRAAPRPVTRINRRVLIALSGTGLLLILGATIFALDPPRLFDRDDTGRELYRTENNPTPDGLEALPRRYSDIARPPVELGPPLPGDIGPAVVNAERELGIGPTPDLPFRPSPEDDAARAERIRQARLAQQGRESGVFFQLTSRTAGVAQADISGAGLPTASGTALTVRRIRLGLARVLAGHHELGKREMHGLPDFVPWGLVLGHKPVSFRLKF
tara:strand:- start:2011 stop:2751 length:741 start_codon:yes stop_codon:yes gene_type:complete